MEAALIVVSRGFLKCLMYRTIAQHASTAIFVIHPDLELKLGAFQKIPPVF